ncbi:hypothetical protein D3C76_277720 [compost metagenome]
MIMQLAHAIPRGDILFLSFYNNYLNSSLPRRGMPWQVNTLPGWQSLAVTGSHWQSLAVVQRERQILDQTLYFQSSVQSTLADTQVLGKLTAGTYKSSKCLFQRAAIERIGSRGLRGHHDGCLR